MQQYNQNNLDLHNNNEQIVWTGTSSQLLNFKHFAIAFFVLVASVWTSLHFAITPLLLIGLVAILYAIFHYLDTINANYTLTNQRIIFTSGLLTRKTNEVELYRIKDVHLFEPLILRIFGLGNIQLISSQRTSKIEHLNGLKNAKELREQMRLLVENRRTEKGVGEYDVN